MTLLLAQAEGLFTNAALAAGGAAAVSVPIAIHLLSRFRRQPRQWAAMRFLIEAIRRQRRRIQLEQLLLLLVRCLILLLLGMALAGPLLGGIARGLGIDTTERLVCIVLDDGLSTTATNIDGRARFDVLKEQALKFMDGVRSSDRIMLWRSGRPIELMYVEGTYDHDRVREDIERLKPRLGRSSLPEALEQINERLEKEGLPADRVVTAVFSDFAAGDAAESRNTAALATLARESKLILTRPMLEAPNVQVEMIAPDRLLVVPIAEGMDPTLGVEVTLRRFGNISREMTTPLTIALQAEDAAAPIAVVQRTPLWTPGQSDVTLKVHLTLPAREADAMFTETGRMFSIHARFDADERTDVLSADNERFTVVELRERVRVAVVGQADASSTGLTPERWLRFALSPSGIDADVDAPTFGPIEVIDVPTEALDEQRIIAMDAVVVLRPDLLDAQQFAALRAVTRRGGVVWCFAPAISTTATWLDRLSEAFALNWPAALEVESRAAPDDDSAPAPNPWRISLEQAIPEALSLLGADWAALVRPITITRRLPVDVSGRPASVWLAMDDGRPLLIASDADAGKLLLMTAAADLDWTNLPAKPLFVPLVQESLRSLLGSSGGREALTRLVSGDQPTLPLQWDGAQKLDMAEQGVSVTLRRSDEGLTPITALQQPGVYEASPYLAGRKLAVNVDAVDGDTAAMDEMMLADWFGGKNTWRWLDESNPQAMLAADISRANFGWPLLWIVLTLVLIETLLARWFSHAAAPGAPRFSLRRALGQVVGKVAG